jgi:hypothetical protein
MEVESPQFSQFSREWGGAERMKSILVLIAGALPLVLLTAANWAQVRSGRAADGLVAGLEPQLTPDQIAAAEKLAAEVGPAADDREFYRQFLDLKPFGSDISTDLAAPAKSPRQQLLAADWIKWQHARRATLRFAEMNRGAPGPQVEIERLTAFLKQQPLHGIPGGDEISAGLEAQARELTRQQEAAAALREAEREFADAHRKKGFEHWLTRFGKLPPTGLDAGQRKAWELLRDQAAFWRHWQSPPGEQTAIKLRLEELAKLRGSTPSASTDEEQAFLKEIDTTIAGLTREVRLESFLGEPKRRLEEWLTGSERILADDPSAAPRLRTALRTFLEQHLKEKPTTDIAPQLQEAFYKDNRYLQGVFQRGSSEGAAEVWYKYWRTVAAFKAGKPYEKTIYVTSLKGPPQAPVDARLIREFNAQIRALRDHLDDKADWAKLDGLCERLNQELENYPADRGLGSQPLSFAAEAGFAREVVDAWERVAKILTNS